VPSISPVGWMCVVPPLVTIVLAIFTKRVVPSLLIGIAIGVVILLPTPNAYEAATGSFSWFGYLQHSLLEFLYEFCELHLWGSLVDADHLRVFAFTTILGMQVALIHASGGMLGIVRWASPFARTRRGGQMMTWFLGLVIFIDDYANTLLLGSTMRPLTDRLRISREKLAFLVDTTAAPVSGLAIVSTWVATEISAMKTGFDNAQLDLGADTFGIFLQTIPVRFYVIFALIYVVLCALLNRDFGPMLSAERRALREPQRSDELPSGETVDLRQPRAWNAILPICVTVGVVVGLLIYTGLVELAGMSLPEPTLQRWGQIIGSGNSSLALIYGSLAGLATSLALIIMQRELGEPQIRSSLLSGFTHVLPAMTILWLAWALSTLTKQDHLATGEFIADKVHQLQVPAALMPTITFLLAGGIAFATGTSWGTMAILMPMIIPLVYGLLLRQLDTPPTADHAIMIASIGSVLAGAIFGDHCSPISDTTILSSRSSGCDHIAHVRTQMPYAMLIAAIAILFGTLPAGYGVSSIWLLPAGVVAMIFCLLLFGRSAEDASRE
jgi:Na+/H+ antiporter NhaC